MEIQSTDSRVEVSSRNLLPSPSNTQHSNAAKSMTAEDDEDVLPLEEQTNRPPNLALHQQRIQAWHPILDPVWVIIALFYMGIIMVPVGFKIQNLSSAVVEISQTYDAYDDPNPLCGIGMEYNSDTKCNLTFVAPEYMKPPILVHYEITNFHQNHKNYYQSRDAYQLLGQPIDQQYALQASLCEPLNKLGNISLNPCGLIANTFFNDVFRYKSGNDANGNPLQLIEKGIAWASDLEYKYAQPEGFMMQECDQDTRQPNAIDGNCSATCCETMDRTDESTGETGLEWSCTIPAVHPDYGTCYKYHYPDEERVQYLYETYPNVISPLEGVTNEHFVVWMRVATLSTFRKLYGYFNEPIAKGETFVIEVEANYVVESFKGSKSLVISTNNIFGGKNDVLGESFIAIGFLCLAMGVFFSLKHWLRPRKLADRRYLHFKED